MDVEFCQPPKSGAAAATFFSPPLRRFFTRRRHYYDPEPPSFLPFSHRFAAVRLQRHRGQPYRPGERPDRAAADAAGQREPAGVLLSLRPPVLLCRARAGRDADPAVRRGHGRKLDVPVRGIPHHRRVHRLPAVLLLSGDRDGPVAAGVSRGADPGEDHGLPVRLRRHRTGERLGRRKSQRHRLPVRHPQRRVLRRHADPQQEGPQRGRHGELPAANAFGHRRSISSAAVQGWACHVHHRRQLAVDTAAGHRQHRLWLLVLLLRYRCAPRSDGGGVRLSGAVERRHLLRPTAAQASDDGADDVSIQNRQ